MLLDFFLAIIGLLLLYYGAEWLVKGSSSFARSLGLSPLVIGLTVVAFGTSAPELLVSVVSSIEGKSMIAVGNVVGSNICNITLVLGLAAFFHPITCHRSIIKRDIPIMLCVSLYLVIISLGSKIGRLEGATLFSGIILYILYKYYNAVKESKQLSIEGNVNCDSVSEEIGHVTSMPKQVVLISLGIAGVIAGAEVLVGSAVRIMYLFGVGEKFIGLTMVAFGTSIPELATSVVAALKKEMEISLGNLVGSNIFNILSVLGAASLIRPIQIQGGFIESGLVIDYLVMIFTSCLLWLMMKKGLSVTRKHGLVLLCCYVGYISYLVLKAHSA